MVSSKDVLANLHNLPKEDADLLVKFLNVERLTAGSEEIYYHTLQGYRKATEGLFTEAHQGHLEKWFQWAETDSGYSPTSLYIYATRLRRLYTFKIHIGGLSKFEAKMRTEQAFENIPIKKLHEANKSLKKRDKLVSPQEFELLIKTAKNPRIIAIMAVLYDSGCRIGELLSLRMRDLQFTEKYASLRVYGKTGERTVPIIKSLPYLRAWLQVHPDPQPDSPVFCYVMKGKIKPMKVVSVQAAFSYNAKKAGITRRIHPHMMRHTKLTELAKSGLSEYQMKSYAGWTSGSRMADTYIKLSGTGHLDSILEIAGIPVEKHRREVDSPLKIVKCPRCGNENPVNALFCYTCSFTLDSKMAAEQVDKITQLEKQIEDIQASNAEVMKLMRDVLKEKSELDKLNKDK